MILGWPNRGPDTTLSGGSWDTTLTINNVKDRYIGKVARSTNATAAATQFQADLGASYSNYSIKAVSLHGHNLSSSATVEIEVGSTAGNNDVHDSGAVSVASESYDSDTDTYLGGDYIPFIYVPSAAISGRYWTIKISDTSNSDGYVELGYLGIWSFFQPTRNYSYGAVESYRNRSRKGKLWYGGFNYEKQQALRKQKVSVEITDAEREVFNSLCRKADITDDLLFVPNESDQGENERFGMLCTFENIPTVNRNFYGWNVADFVLEERV